MERTVILVGVEGGGGRGLGDWAWTLTNAKIPKSTSEFEWFLKVVDA